MDDRPFYLDGSTTYPNIEWSTASAG